MFVGGGFIGGIVGGLIAGFTALWISQLNVPQWFRGLMPVVVIPLFASLVVGLLMFCSSAGRWPRSTTGLTNWLNGMSGSSAILLGVILGLMMCFDLGGPVNKAAYAFATAGLVAADHRLVRDHGRGDGRRHGAAAGAGAGVHGAARAVHRAGAGERQGRLAARRLVHLRGRHPVRGGRPAAGDPVDDGRRRRDRCAIMAIDVTLRAPHGGIFVFFAIGTLLWFLVALVAGTVVGRSRRHRRQAVREAAPAKPTKRPRWPPPDPHNQTHH